MAARSFTPSACDTLIVGMVTVGSLPPRPGAAPATLLAMITPIAPAFCAFLALTAKPQVPRSITTTLPALAAVSAPLNGRQPWPAPTVSGAIVEIDPSVIPLPTAGPKEAVP